MAEIKETGVVTSQVDLESTNMNLPAEKKGTIMDQRDMFRMGKAQELRVSNLRNPDQGTITDGHHSEISVSSPSLGFP